MIRRSLVKTVLAVSLLMAITSIQATTQTPVQKHGWLTAKGGYLLDEHGKIVQLRGMSFYWATPSNWMGAKWYTTETLDALVDSWKCTVVRLAYNPNSDPTTSWNRCKIVLDQAIKRGIYVIIDWHSHTAHNEETAAKTFFTTQAQAYKNTPNVIFELYNEPITTNGNNKDGTQTTALATWKDIKSYLTNISKTIRDQDAKNLIICGTPYYAQFVNVAKADTIPYNNIAYSFHFYAGSHGPNSMEVKNTGKGGQEPSYLSGALGQITIFVTEWGTTYSDGKQSVDSANTKWWFDNYINGEYHLSHCNWSVSDEETSSAFGASGASSTSPSGAVVKPLLTSPTTDTYALPSESGEEGPAKSTVFSTPATTIPAWNYNRWFGGSITRGSVKYAQRDDRVNVKTAKDSCLKVEPGVKNDWVSYNVNATTATKNLIIRCLTTSGSGSIDVSVDGTKATTITVPRKAGWNSLLAPVAVGTGAHTIKFNFTAAADTGYSIEWLELTNSDVGTKDMINNSSKQIPVSVSTANSGITLSLPGNHIYSSYTLVGVNGQIAQSGLLSKNTTSLSINSLPGGLWFLKLNGSSGTMVFKTLINN